MECSTAEVLNFFKEIVTAVYLKVECKRKGSNMRRAPELIFGFAFLSFSDINY
jgi:hypothetical protein